MAEGDGEAGYAEWRCRNCGHGVPKHNPPCSRCGNMRFERVEVRASEFDDETVAAPAAVSTITNAWTTRPVRGGAVKS